MNSELKNKLQSCRDVALEFTRRYYHTFDRRRHETGRQFLDGATFVWNGNGFSGADQIQKYILELPSTEHTITTVDGQPIVDDAVGGQPTHLIHVGGTVTYDGGPPNRPFQQSFLITKQENVWKIVSDTYRMQHYLVNETE